jgi:hypothetical protein
MNKKYLLATQKFYQDPSLARNNPFASSIEYGLVATSPSPKISKEFNSFINCDVEPDDGCSLCVHR